MDVSEHKKTKQNCCCEKITAVLRRFSEQNRQNVFFVLLWLVAKGSGHAHLSYTKGFDLECKFSVSATSPARLSIYGFHDEMVLLFVSKPPITAI